jgi:hypothetical protein
MSDVESAPSRPNPGALRAQTISARLRLLVALGLTLMLAGGLGLTLALLPADVHTTLTRIWLGIGVIGLVVTVLAIIGFIVRPVFLLVNEWPQRSQHVGNREE